MDKGDFIGREALSKKNKGTCLFGVTCATDTPTSGSKVMEGDNIVGHITAGVPSPTLKLGIGYVRFYEPKEWPGKKLKLKLPNGKIRIQDTFNVDKDFTTVGAASIVPGLQQTADRLVDISYKTRNIKGRTDEGGIKIDVLIDSGFVKKKRGSAFDKIKKIRNK